MLEGARVSGTPRQGNCDDLHDRLHGPEDPSGQAVGMLRLRLHLLHGDVLAVPGVAMARLCVWVGCGLWGCPTALGQAVFAIFILNHI